jgi:predicted nucleic-acid-binding protein
MKVFLDTNIILDFLEQRGDHTLYAATIFQLGIDKEIDLFVTDLSIVNVVYILRKTFGKQRMYEILQVLRKFVTVIDIGEEVIDEAIAMKGKDFEDVVQFMAAKKKSMECIITRNKKDFSESRVPVYTPEDFLLRLNKSI